MAEMIPDRLPARASRGEELLFNLLKTLPDDCLVYYEPIVSDRYPDFLVVLPHHGLLIAEVKGWYPKTIVSADSESVVLQERGQEKRAQHPIAQARGYVNRLLDQARAPGFEALRHEDGPHQGRLRFPIGHFAILTNIRTAQLAERFPDEALARVFPSERIICRDVLERWGGLEAGGLLDTLAGLITPSWPITPMSPAEIDALRGLLHPEIRLPQAVKTPPAAGLVVSSPAVEEAPRLAVLDTKQERNALNIGDGHRILFGVAGSGKTVILLARAKYLAGQDPRRRVLVLCYNVVLANYLRGALAALPNVECYNFHAWCRRYAPAVYAPEDERDRTQARARPEDRDALLGRRMLAVLEAGEACSHDYDAILVDEAQDFHPAWFPCIVEALVDPEDGDLLIVADGAQSLYKRSGFTWAGVGIKARGRTLSARFDLQTNYRNSREIAELSRGFLTPLDAAGGDPEDGIGTIGADQLRASRGTGVLPLLLRCESEDRQEPALIGTVEALLAGRWDGQPLAEPVPPSEIAILYRALFPGYRPRLLRLLAGIRRLGPVIWVSDPADRRARERIDEDGVKVMTVHAAKGLQFRAVLVPWLEGFTALSGHEDYDEAVERRLLYVAMTRATDFLCLTGPADHVLVREIEGLDGLARMRAG